MTAPARRGPGTVAGPRPDALRTFIALIVVFVYFSLTTPNFLAVPTLVDRRQAVAINAILAIGMTFVILTGGIDLSVGSIVGLAGMVAGGLISGGLHIAALGDHHLPEHGRDHADRAWRRHRHRADQRPAHHPPQRGAVHRHPRHALCRARRRAAHLQRADLPQPRRQPGLGNTGFPMLGAGRCSACPSRSSPWSFSPASRPTSPRARRSAATSTPSAATSAPRRCPACASTGSRWSST